MSVVLYHSWFSTCSQKVRLALAEKHLAYDSVVIDLKRKEHLTAKYLAINPNGVVPSLEHDNRVVIDSSVICEYLDEVFPGHADNGVVASWKRVGRLGYCLSPAQRTDDRSVNRF